MSVAENLAAVRARIDEAAKRCGRDPREVTLLAVGKTKPASMLEEAWRAGQRDLGENYAQELEEKAAALAQLDGIVWHFIGRLQTNKAKVVARVASVVHAVDNARLVDELGKRAVSRTAPLDVLVEVNVGGEASKGGVAPDALETLLAKIESTRSLRLRGLMSIPPPSENAEKSRSFHRRLRALRDEHGGVSRLPVLSMGMTDDLEVAVEEGATIVRVGTAIFGARDTHAT